jgi:hypothetical protein
MGLKSWLVEKATTQATGANEFWQTSVPPIAVLAQTEEPTTNLENQYELYEALVDKDPELAGTLDDMAALVVTYYKGLYLDIGEDKSESDPEKKLSDRIEQLEEDFDFMEYLEAVVHGALKHGDTLTTKNVKTVLANGEARRIPDPVFLPRQYTSFARKRNIQYAQDTFVQRPRWVGVNRYAMSGIIFVGNDQVQWYRYVPMRRSKDKMIVPSQILHYSLRKDGTLERDQYRNLNLNVISKSPLKSLELTVQWKRQSILMDMMWRSSNVPFLHHKVDLNAYDPTRMPGATQEEKIATSKRLATADLQDYTAGQASRASDQGLVTANTTEIQYIEPRTQSYADPNPSIGQINNSINSRMGSLQRVKDKSGGGSFAADLLMSSITEPRLRVIAFKFIKILENYVREFLAVEKFDKELLRKVKIRMNLILPHERLDRAREGLFMQQSNSFLKDEIREVEGHLPLSKKERELLKKEFDDFQARQNPFGDSDKSAGDTVGDSKRGGSSAEDETRTPHTERSANK